MHEHLRSHARTLDTLVRGYFYIAGCEFSLATVVRADALQSKRTLSLGAYGVDGYPNDA